MSSHKTHLQRALDDAWSTDPQRCEREGYPRTTKGLDAWQLLCLESALSLPIGSTPRPKQPKRRTPAQKRAIQQHRDALATARKAVAEWAAQENGERDPIAAAMLELLSEATRDTTGDDTLNVASELLDTYAELLGETRANKLAHAIGALPKAAHNLGRVHTLHVER